MKKVSTETKKSGMSRIAAKVAKEMATTTANSTCAMWAYQDKESKEVKNLRKF